MYPTFCLTHCHIGLIPVRVGIGDQNHDGSKRGIRIGSARDGSVTAFIPDPVEKATTTSAAEGVAADASGNIYGAEVAARRIMKYAKQ